MTSESQKRARDKWNAANVTKVQFSLYPKDAELVEYLNARASVEGKADFLRRLIREDMERNRGE